jgi:hypothetical protein
MKKKISLYAVILITASIMLTFPLSTTYAATLPWFMKPSFPDYAPSGMPDFDQRQGGTYLWQYTGLWSHCGPVAVANSLWWLDSEFEVSTTPPPTTADNFPLVRAYGAWDDHAPQNVPPFVEHLAYLMDTNGLRTGIAHLGTSVTDMQTGITQYLSWSGVNPLGDVDGDGAVTPADQAIVMAAMGKAPGMPGWDMRADIFPVTTLPAGGAADNIIDPNDLNLVLMHMGLTGKFYEHTVMAPPWEVITTEVMRCQDVVLLIAPWLWTGSTWYRYDEAAHFVTVAGLNATTMEIVFSNPITDNAEAGGPGDVPVPHVHAAPEPPYITHNNASLVSHDMYPVIVSPCPGGPLALPTYSGSIVPPPPGSIWQIEAAVITSPLGIRNIAVTGMTVCYGQTNLAQNRTHNINITVVNQGSIDDVFDLTLYYNRTNILETTRMLLAAGQTKVVTFHWHATQKRYWVYALSAVATPVCGEVDTSDNTLIGPNVKIVWPGDVNGDRQVSILDVTAITGAYAAKYPNPSYRPNSDIDDTGDLTILDVVLCTGQYAVTIPP